MPMFGETVDYLSGFGGIISPKLRSGIEAAVKSRGCFAISTRLSADKLQKLHVTGPEGEGDDLEALTSTINASPLETDPGSLAQASIKNLVDLITGVASIVQSLGSTRPLHIPVNVYVDGRPTEVNRNFWHVYGLEDLQSLPAMIYAAATNAGMDSSYMDLELVPEERIIAKSTMKSVYECLEKNDNEPGLFLDIDFDKGTIVLINKKEGNELSIAYIDREFSKPLPGSTETSRHKLREYITPSAFLERFNTHIKALREEVMDRMGLLSSLPIVSEKGAQTIMDHSGLYEKYLFTEPEALMVDPEELFSAYEERDPLAIFFVEETLHVLLGFIKVLSDEEGATLDYMSLRGRISKPIEESPSGDILACNYLNQPEKVFFTEKEDVPLDHYKPAEIQVLRYVMRQDSFDNQDSFGNKAKGKNKKRKSS